jgi:hypothetical protein
MNGGPRTYAESAKAMRAWLFVVLCLLAVWSSSCGSSQPKAGAPPVSRDALFGIPVNVTIVFRPKQMSREPMFAMAFAGAMQKKSREEAELMATLLAATRIDALINVRDWSFRSKAKDGNIAYAVVIRGLPASKRSKLRAAGDKPTFTSSARTPTGVVEYTSAKDSSFYGGTLFVMPDETWVVVDDRTAPRARAHYQTASTAPPAVDLDDDLVAAAFADRAALDALDAVFESEGGSNRLREVWPRLESVGLAMSDSSARHIDVFLDHPNGEDAELTTRALSAELAQARNDAGSKCPPLLREWCRESLAKLRIEQRGERVVVAIPY